MFSDLVTLTILKIQEDVCLGSLNTQCKFCSRQFSSVQYIAKETRRLGYHHPMIARYMQLSSFRQRKCSLGPRIC